MGLSDLMVPPDSVIAFLLLTVLLPPTKAKLAPWPMTLPLVILIAVALLLLPVTVLLLCFIMGLQNALITKISKSEFRSTHLTGVVTDLGARDKSVAFFAPSAHAMATALTVAVSEPAKRASSSERHSAFSRANCAYSAGSMMTGSTNNSRSKRRCSRAAACACAAPESF